MLDVCKACSKPTSHLFTGQEVLSIRYTIILAEVYIRTNFNRTLNTMVDFRMRTFLDRHHHSPSTLIKPQLNEVARMESTFAKEIKKEFPTLLSVYTSQSVLYNSTSNSIKFLNRFIKHVLTHLFLLNYSISHGKTW